MRAALCFCICAAIGLLLGTCDTSPTNSTDRVPPATIRTVWVSDSGDTWANLCWIAPGDDSVDGRASKYEIRTLPGLLTPQNWPTATVVPQTMIPQLSGRTEQFLLENPESGCLCVGIRARDDAGNWSALSTTVCIRCRDTIPPLDISDLTAEIRDDTLLVLNWTASGDDSLVGRASGYEVRASNQLITPENWSAASPVEQHLVPQIPGTLEALQTRWTSTDTFVYVGVRAQDEAGNWSGLSNVPNAYAVDTVRPSTITDLVAEVIGDTLISLKWSAPGEDGMMGRVNRYAISAAPTEISDSSWNAAVIIPQTLLPAAPGQPEQFTFAWPVQDTALYFAMIAIDYSGNISHVSNNARAIHRSRISLLWHYEFIAPPALRPVSVARLSDGCFAVLGSYVNGTGPSDIAVVKVDSVGNQYWQAILGGEAAEAAAAIAPTADAGCVVGGTTWSFADSSGDPYLARLSSSGGVLWEKQIGVPGPDGLRDLAIGADGSIAVVGSDHTVSDNPAGWVGLTDPNGTVLWRKYITASSWCPVELPPAWATSTGVAFVGSGNFAVSTNSEYVDGGGHTGCNPPKEAVSLSVWSPSGGLIRSGEYGFCEAGFAYANKIAASAAGNVLAPWSDLSSPTLLTLSNIPTSSSNHWAISVSGFPNFGPPLPCWLPFDSRALLFGHAQESDYGPSSAFTQAVVAMFSSTGQSLCTTSFGTEMVSEDPLAIFPASDHDVFCIYASNRSTGYMIGFARLRISY